MNSRDYCRIIETVRFQEFSKEKDRRSELENMKKYVKLWKEYYQTLQEKFDAQINIILKKHDISQTTWNNSMKLHLANGNQEIFLMQSNLIQNLK